MFARVGVSEKMNYKGIGGSFGVIDMWYVHYFITVKISQYMCQNLYTKNTCSSLHASNTAVKWYQTNKQTNSSCAVLFLPPDPTLLR